MTTLGAGVDGSVQRIERAYDVRGNNVRITSLDNPTVGSGSVVNEVTFEFNDFNQRIDSGQAHDGVVVPGTTPSVTMSYADGSNNTIRPTSITYPNGRTITRDYGTAGSITDKLNQVSSLIDDDSEILAAYERLGLHTIIQQTSPQPDLRYTLISPTLSIDPTTGDIYSGLDRFGRVKDVRWQDVSADTDLSRIKYGYDRASNRTWRENPSDPNREHDWLYAYDGLHRLSSAERGELNTAHTALTVDQFNQCWSLDPTGNWKGFQQDDNADGTADLIQTRTANTVNEITDITNTTGAAWATPTYDLNGNSLVQPRPDLGPGASMTGIYDAWNRMVKLLDSDTSNVLLENQFDGRNFRITAIAGTNPKRHYYFTDNWQCVEERVGTVTTPERQHVWGIRYIDDLVLRDRATGTSTTLNERLYHLADANWNTTAIVDDSGAVQERYEYTPYGVISYFAADFTARSISNYDTRYTYTNREWAPVAGLYYFRNRWYDAVLGRFSSRDPIGLEGSPWSLYEYVESQPVSKLDPFGWISVTVQGPRTANNAPWISVEIPDDKWGRTSTGISLSCMCSDPAGDVTCTVEYDAIIYIDEKKIRWQAMRNVVSQNLPLTPEAVRREFESLRAGVYGHEQLHYRNNGRIANEIAKRIRKMPGSNCMPCDDYSKAILNDMMDIYSVWHVGETKHLNPDSPPKNQPVAPPHPVPPALGPDDLYPYYEPRDL